MNIVHEVFKNKNKKSNQIFVVVYDKYEMFLVYK